MPRRSPPSTRASAPRPTRAMLAEQQTELFPERPRIEVLDPRASVGPRTGVLCLMRIRLRASDAPHLIFHDRHGWYCEEHGAPCPAVRVAREAEAEAEAESPSAIAADDEPEQGSE